MEKKTEQSVLPSQRITPPTESHVSAVLNGIGNGMMVGALPFVVLDLYGKITRGEKFSKLGVAITATGCLVGAVYGVRESHRLKKYRDEVNAEINELRNNVDSHEAKLNHWLKETQKFTPATQTQTKNWSEKVKESSVAAETAEMPAR